MTEREQFIQQFVQAGKAKGASREEVAQKLELALAKYDQMQPATQELGQEQSPSNPVDYATGTVGNIPSSAVENAKQIGSALWNTTNPNPQENTLYNMLELGLEGSQYLGNPLARTTQEGLGMDPNAEKLKAFGKFQGERFGLWNDQEGLGLYPEQFADTVYNDPVGVALDLIPAGKGATLGKAGRVADTAGDVGKVGTFRKSLNNASDFLSERALRASKTQLDDFEDIAKMPAGQFVRENNLWGGAGRIDPVNNAIKDAQEIYNGLVRKGKEIPTKLYADELRRRAIEMLENNASKEGRRLAENLWEEANVQERIAPTMKDTTLVNTKSGLLSKGVDDSMTKSFRQEEGLAGIRALDEYAPGSAKVGKKLQSLRTFRDIAKKQGKLGRGTQIINGFKGPVSAGGAGAIVGAFVGNPVAGAAIGSGLATVANSRRVQSGLAKALAGKSKAVNAVGNAANEAGKVFKKPVQAVTPVRGVLEEQRKKVKDKLINLRS